MNFAVSKPKPCPCCGTERSPLEHSRLGYADGLHHFNCSCGSTYCLTPSELLHAVTAEQQRIAERVITESLNSPERKERRRIANELAVQLGFTAKENKND